MIDMWKKQRHAKGQALALSKLTQEQVIEIRKRRKAGETCRGLAREYGVTYPTISNICTGKRWAWLTEEVS
jgi:hypothetical protein